MSESARDTEQSTLQSRAIRRLAVAAVLVGVAVVALSILSHRKTVSPPVATTSTRPATTQETMRSIEIAPPAPTPPAPTPPAPTPPASTPPAGVPTTPPPPQVINSATTIVKKPRALPRRQSPRTQPTYYSLPTRKISPAVTRKTIRQPRPSTPPVVPPLPAPNSYVVQLGVFGDYHNAIDLQKRLAQHGIKSYTETRLNLGPFHSKIAAEQSMAKLRRLGISAVVVPNR